MPRSHDAVHCTPTVAYVTDILFYDVKRHGILQYGHSHSLSPTEEGVAIMSIRHYAISPLYQHTYADVPRVELIVLGTCHRHHFRLSPLLSQLSPATIYGLMSLDVRRGSAYQRHAGGETQEGVAVQKNATGMWLWALGRKHRWASPEP